MGYWRGAILVCFQLFIIQLLVKFNGFLMDVLSFNQIVLRSLGFQGQAF